MERKALVNFIQSHLPVPSQTVHDIALHFEEKQLDKNDFFLKDGRISREYLFLEEGFMRSFAFDVDGNEVTTAFYGANQVVFEVASFFNHTASRENIQAITACRGYSITFEQLDMLFHSIPVFREFGRAILVKGFVLLKQRTLSLITETAEERYSNLMHSNPEIFMHAPLKNIASYLGITDTSLSRIRKEFIKK